MQKYPDILQLLFVLDVRNQSIRKIFSAQFFQKTKPTKTLANPHQKTKKAAII
jgi:hypothetical protein